MPLIIMKVRIEPHESCLSMSHQLKTGRNKQREFLTQGMQICEKLEAQNDETFCNLARFRLQRCGNFFWSFLIFFQHGHSYLE